MLILITEIKKIIIELKYNYIFDHFIPKIWLKIIKIKEI